MIEITGLTKRYGTVNALSDISFKVEKGQIVGFLGANGAGKTTTMDIICGCIGADQGSVKICDFDITEQPIQAKKRLGYLPDIPPLHGDMPVEEFIDYTARLRKVPANERKTKVDSVIEKLSLGDVRKRLVGNLSKGFRQRVALAQALVHDPDVLVLDEPTEGLDPTQIIHIRELIKSLAGQHTIILSSHILSEVQAMCDHIVIIHKGKIVTQGTYAELLAQIESGTHYRVRVARDGRKLSSELAEITGISRIEANQDDANLIDFFVPSNQIEQTVEQVAKRALGGGYGLTELTTKAKSLEEIFLQLTQ